MIRFILVILALIVLTLLLLPLQLLGIAFNLRWQRTIPHIYHRILCALAGVRIHQTGHRSPDTPVLILANHIGDIEVLRDAVTLGKRRLAENSSSHTKAT